MRAHRFAIATLLAAALLVAGFWWFPAPPPPDGQRPAPSPMYSTRLDAGKRLPRTTTPATATADQLHAKTTTADRSTAPCDPDPDRRTLQRYRQLSAQEWRNLNQWQQERGLSQTRLRADHDLMQEPSPYLHYDVGSLQRLAAVGDADAQYWLATQYRDSGEQQIHAEHGSEDAQLVIARLLQQAAHAGHVPAMLAISQRYHEQLTASANAQDFPDLQIKARAWLHVAAWRLGRLPDRSTALADEREAQAAQLATQLIEELQQQRQRQGLPAFSNVVPDAVIALLQAGHTGHCPRLAQDLSLPQPSA
ncbi:MAG: hypothetical protein ACOY3E_15465 [Pseudomonadota bacterium]